MKILTFDIGGANTKKLVYKDGGTKSSLYNFPMWKKRDKLRDFLEGLREDADTVAVTMTAELCDVFSSKDDGARFIVSACEEVFDEPLFLTINQSLVKKNDIKDYKDLAATNWLASVYLMRKRFGSGILVDIGSTTTDILPFGDGTRYLKTDFERLRAGQLLYTGYLRTPVNAVISKVPAGGHMIPIASEYFAITADVYNVLLGVNYTCETPDGKGKSRKESMARIARLLCADLDEVEDYVVDICRYVHEMQLKGIAKAIERISKGTETDNLYVAGIGRQLGIEAGEQLGLNTFNLEEKIKDAWNLPCLGLAEMVLDKEEM
ncbi:MAG: hydantoinase/oxoprolinase family protein [Candidatus Hydrothermarchaeales archaeon]